jgi:cytochrome c-type biogenesis protein CcmE
MAENLTVRGAARRRRALRRLPPETAPPPPKTAFFRRRRFLIAALIVVAAVGTLIYMGIRGSSMYYMTVAEVQKQGDAVYGDKIRMGATVVDGSIETSPDGVTRFTVTDGANTLPVSYSGGLPDAFEDGADVVLQGKMAPSGTFEASSLLAKCPSKYEPAANGGSAQTSESTSGGNEGN